MMQQIDGQRADGNDRVHRAIAAMTELAEIFAHRRESLAREAGITVEQWRVMEQIAAAHFVPSLFARARESSAAAVSKILRQLLDAGLASVTIARADRRQRRYALTAKGRRAFEALRAARRAAIEAVWKDFSHAELAEFSAFAEKLCDRIENYATREIERVAKGR
jgi:DNA-binding MarR family transcriptional regulator